MEIDESCSFSLNKCLFTPTSASRFTSLVDLPNLGIKPGSPTLQADSLPSKPPGNPQNAAMEMLKSMFWCTSPGQQPKGAFPSFCLFLLPLNLCAEKCWASWLANCIVFNSLIFQAKEPILQWDTRPAFMHYSSGWQYEWLNNHIKFLLEIPGGLEIIT